MVRFQYNREVTIFGSQKEIDLAKSELEELYNHPPRGCSMYDQPQARLAIQKLKKNRKNER